MSRCERRDAPLVGPHVDASGAPRRCSTHAGRCDCPGTHQETGRGQRPARGCQEVEGLAKVGTRQPAHPSPREQHRGGVLRARQAEGKAISALPVRSAAARPPRPAGTVVALSRAAEGSLPGRGRRLPAPVVTRHAAAPHHAPGHRSCRRSRVGDEAHSGTGAYGRWGAEEVEAFHRGLEGRREDRVTVVRANCGRQSRIHEAVTANVDPTRCRGGRGRPPSRRCRRASSARRPFAVADSTDRARLILTSANRGQSQAAAAGRTVR
jgi:hypothetical protein